MCVYIYIYIHIERERERFLLALLLQEVAQLGDAQVDGLALHLTRFPVYPNVIVVVVVVVVVVVAVVMVHALISFRADPF